MKIVYILTFLLFTSVALSGEKAGDKLRPANLDFSTLQEELDTYVKKFPESEQATEKRRVGIVKNFKKMVTKVLSRNNYKGKIYLKGKTYEGEISKANDSGLTMTVAGKEKLIKWEEVNPRQYADIFIAEAIKKAENLTADKRDNASETFKKAGNYYFALSVFYDWYNNQAASKVFRKKALVLNPDLKGDIDKLWPTQEVTKKE